MSIDRFARVERRLPGLFADLADARTPDYLEAAIERASSRPQRPSWTFPERWLPVELVSQRVLTTRMPWRQLGVLALIALLLAAMLAVYIGSQTPHLPPPFGPAGNGLIPYTRNGDIYLGDLATGSSRLVLAGPEEDVGAGYSPDGTLIGFMRVVSSTDKDVYVIRPDGSGLRRLNDKPYSNLEWSQWSPESRYIGAIRPVFSNDCVCVTNQLELLDALGKDPVRIVASAPEMSYVQFRPPDGRELLYRALVDGKWGLFAMSPDGTNQHPIVPATVPAEMDATFANVAYSADGSRILFQQYSVDANMGEPGCCQLFVVDADGSNLHKFISSSVGTWDGQPSVSPDGNLVAFWHNLPDQANRVTVIRADGSGQLVLTGPELPGGAHWVWAPDSSKILMFPNDSDTGKAYLLDPAGGPWTTVPWISGADIDWQRLALTS